MTFETVAHGAPASATPDFECDALTVQREGDDIWIMTPPSGGRLTLGEAASLSRYLADLVPEREGLITPREREVLRHLVSGFSNKETAKRLALSVRTVETHRLNLRSKTKTGRLKDLVLLAKFLNLKPVAA